MEHSEKWVYECSIDIKSEPDDIGEFNETTTFHKTSTEPSTSNAVLSNKSAIPSCSYDMVKENEIEIISVKDSTISSDTSDSQSHKTVEKEMQIVSEQDTDKNDNQYSSHNFNSYNRKGKGNGIEIILGQEFDKNAALCDSYNCQTEEEKRGILPELDYKVKDNICSKFDQKAQNSCENGQKLLEGIYTVETQRVQAIKDLNELYELQEQALSDPPAFVKKLQDHNIDFSTLSEAHEFPITDWSKYELNFNAYRVRRQQTKLAAKVSDLAKRVEKRVADEDCFPTDEKMPKGRYKIWTAEEQKKLEELLIKFPNEPVETRRWEKIALHLEDRTPGQVAGRVKKYFKALKKHGIPIKDGVPVMDNIKNLSFSGSIDPKPTTCPVSNQPHIYIPDGFKMKSNLLRKHRRNYLYHFWTEAEQKKLDELLIKYPLEENESSRWEKISKHFKNRSAGQVAARVNYLKRLMQIGQFVPGKIPGIQFNEMNEDFPRYSHGGNIMRYWTPEEQEKLERLLWVIPPEKHEFQRWTKIAKFFENRTPVQVGSRAKRYFVMLKRYGCPVPGKAPRNIPRLKFSRKKNNKASYDSGTLFDFHQSPHQSSSSIENSISSPVFGSIKEEINADLERMEKAFLEKKKSSGLTHCSNCKEPIVGVRWHCVVCKKEPINFCSDCSASNCKGLGKHKFNHPLEAIQPATDDQ